MNFKRGILETPSDVAPSYVEDAVAAAAVLLPCSGTISIPQPPHPATTPTAPPLAPNGRTNTILIESQMMMRGSLFPFFLVWYGVHRTLAICTKEIGCYSGYHEAWGVCVRGRSRNRRTPFFYWDFEASPTGTTAFSNVHQSGLRNRLRKGKLCAELPSRFFHIIFWSESSWPSIKQFVKFVPQRHQIGTGGR